MTNQPETTTDDRAGETDAAATHAEAAPTDAAPTDDDPAAPTDPADDESAETTETVGGETAEGETDATDAAGHELAEGEQPDWDERADADGRTAGQLLEALDEAQGDRDEYLDALQRSRAEFDNFRRRSAREAAGARAAGVGDLATQLLDVLDDLDRTVKVAEDSSDEGLAAGITAVRRKLVDALVAAGVERIDEAGVPFDATRHEAVQKIDADEPVDEPEVAQVLRPGYVHGDRVLRAAMVSVRQ